MPRRHRELRNFAASVHQRLRNLAHDRGADFRLILHRYAGERFLFRLAVSSEVNRFVLKGAALFLVWAGNEFRASRDVDFHAMVPADHAALGASFEAICAVTYAPDGLVFDPATIKIADILEEAYGGVRVKLRAMLGKAVVPLQIDIGFGDVITPDRQEADYPTLLDHPSPRLWTYPRETAVAEKFETMVRRGQRNSRMRDFWDVAALAQHFTFDGETLAMAIAETFRRRRTALSEGLPDALRPAFYEDPNRIKQWEAFQRNVGAVVEAPTRFGEAGVVVRAFLGPVRENLVTGEPFTQVWPRGGPWRPAHAVIGRGGDRV